MPSRAALTLTVTAATLVSIAVTPANPTIGDGLTEQFTATGTYTDSSTQNITTQVTWASSNTGIATISNAGGSQGLASTAGAGSTTISATSGAISGSTTLTVTTFSIGGTVSGLSASGLMLTDNGGNALSVLSGSSSFTFSNQLAYGASYAVAVSVQPTGQTCSVANGSGTVSGNVTSVTVTCTTNTYSIGGSISGLTASGLVLTDNGGDALSVNSRVDLVHVRDQLAYGSSYAVAVSTQPTGQICTVSNGSGTVTGTVTSVSISCVTSYTIGGTISGLNVSSVVLANGSATVTVSAGSSSWVFATAFATGSSYSVTVQTQPAGETCQVASGGSGTLSANVNNVTVVCAFGVWTWESGSSAANASGVYGTKGTPAASNVPGARDYGLSWIDSAGNLWLFGGQGPSGDFNDLWEYSPSTGEWTWVSGGSGFNANGSYGTEGSASASNVPGARIRSVSWIDSSGNLWLFGGSGYGASGGAGDLNDLWEYSPTTGEWTWVSGSKCHQRQRDLWYRRHCRGQQRAGRALCAELLDRRLGQTCGYSADMAMAPRAVRGPSTICGNTLRARECGPGSAVQMPSTPTGPMVPKALPRPATCRAGARGALPGSTRPATCGCSGANGYAATGGSGLLNDLWKYSPSTGEWTWVNGGNGINAGGVFGTEGIASASNVPGGRWLASSWIDSSGNLWLFGGTGKGASGPSGYLDDLWEYNPTTGEWTWVSGSQSGNPNGVYGTQGTGSPSNVPGGRQGASGWIDSSGAIWLFGGFGEAASGQGYLNDLWRFSAG